jgi:hypothetical protein
MSTVSAWTTGSSSTASVFGDGEIAAEVLLHWRNTRWTGIAKRHYLEFASRYIYMQQRIQVRHFAVRG